MATTLTASTTLCFLERPHPNSLFILCAWYTIWVLIPIKTIVLSLFLAFITLSDLYYPHHPPSEGFTFHRQKKGILYIQVPLRGTRVEEGGRSGPPLRTPLVEMYRFDEL